MEFVDESSDLANTYRGADRHSATNRNNQSPEDRFQIPSRTSSSNISVHDIQPNISSPHKSSDAGISPAYSTIDEAGPDTATHPATYQRDDSHEQIFEPVNNVDDSNAPAFDANRERNTAAQESRSSLEYTQHDFHLKTRSASSVNSHSILTQDTPTSPFWSYQERREWPLDNTNEFHLLQHYVNNLAPWVCTSEGCPCSHAD